MAGIIDNREELIRKLREIGATDEQIAFGLTIATANGIEACLQWGKALVVPDDNMDETSVQRSMSTPPLAM